MPWEQVSSRQSRNVSYIAWHSHVNSSELLTTADILQPARLPGCSRVSTVPSSCRGWSGSLADPSVQFSSVAQSCPTLQSHGPQHARLPCPSPTPGAGSNSQPSSQWCHPTIFYPLSSPSPALNLSQHEGLFQWVGPSHQVAKVLQLQLQHQSFQWIFGTDFL